MCGFAPPTATVRTTKYSLNDLRPSMLASDHPLPKRASDCLTAEEKHATVGSYLKNWSNLFSMIGFFWCPTLDLNLLFPLLFKYCFYLDVQAMNRLLLSACVAQLPCLPSALPSICEHTPAGLILEIETFMSATMIEPATFAD
ncbi:hypothetical protein IF2G_05171 [Cordyceps javanica]|nr:hypothetical protein IF2G_05171 [Cordyceps javanica]